LALSSHLAETGESAFFDQLATDEVERSDELMVVALVEALDGLTEPPRRTSVGGFGTDDMDAWLWGLRHQVQLRSLLAVYGGDDPLVEVIAEPFSINTDVLPLADGLSADDPRVGIAWFPRPGDGFTVDAADPMYGEDHFFYGFGPVMRMVWHLTPDGPRGYNVLPGGQSALADDPHFADQAARWLGNDAIPMAYAPAEVAASATAREVFVPQ
jgi:penicillin amidase